MGDDESWGGQTTEDDAGKGESCELLEERERENGFGREKWFPEKETLKTEIPQNGNFPKIPFGLPLTITSPNELRFLCTSCLRTRFNTIYNFCEENLFKFLFEQKVNLRAPPKALIQAQRCKFHQVQIGLGPGCVI